jgi:hypothetical protein
MNLYIVTGTFHGSHISCKSEGEARRIFHTFYNGESIITLKCITQKELMYIEYQQSLLNDY